jgi:hydroxyethylthiazole kinase-like uncharacterized protein yjeF
VSAGGVNARIEAMDTVTRDQMARVDELSITRHGLTVKMMAERLAGRVLNVASDLVKGVPGKNIVVVIGKGNNGASGVAVALRLKSQGANVTVISAYPDERLVESGKTLLFEAKSTGIPVRVFGGDSDDVALISGADLIIDALLGYKCVGDPRPPLDQIINLINESPAKVLSLDLPSGLDADTGNPGNPTVQAEATVTVERPKKGFGNPKAGSYLGTVLTASVGVPPDVWNEALQ